MSHTTVSPPPIGLMCELLAHPERTRISTSRPRFSWIVEPSPGAGHQLAFQLLVAAGRATIDAHRGDMWDSGAPDPRGAWQADNRSVAVRYDGAPLSPNTSYWWKVRVWTVTDAPSPWSEPQRFTTGSLDEEGTSGYPLQTSPEEPSRIVQVGDGLTFVDFARAAFGTVELTVDSPCEADVEVRLGEVAAGPYELHRAPGGARRYRSLPLHLNAGRHTYLVTIPPDARNTGPYAVPMPEEVGEVMPFRYCEIAGSPVPIRRGDIRRRYVHYPFEDEAACFVSSSAVLNDVWELCRYSMKATSFCGLYVDGDRERIPYEADAYINQLSHYAADREFTMARRTHEYLIHRPTWPTEWILYSVLLAWNDYLYTGDPASIERYYHDLQAKTLVDLAREDGLLQTADREIPAQVLDAIHYTGPAKEHFRRDIADIVDWPQGERDGFDLRPVNTVVNCLHYRVLPAMAAIAEAVSRPEDARWYRTRAGVVGDAIRRALVDPRTGLMVDGEGSDHSSLHANMFALAAGLVPRESLPAVVRHVESRGMACSVYAAQILLEGLYEAGAAEHALALLTSSGERSWSHMVYDVGTTIALEAWDDRFKPNQDWNHAWGAAPGNIIVRYLMGVRPAEPGFRRMIVQPQPGGLAFAEARVPTVRGPVTVRVENEPGGRLCLEATIPGNTVAQVGVPAGSPDDAGRAVSFDGRGCRARRDRGTLWIDDVGPGRHTFCT
jgi:alpha-L-rhamnosidase